MKEIINLAFWGVLPIELEADTEDELERLIQEIDNEGFEHKVFRSYYTVDGKSLIIKKDDLEFGKII